MKSAIIITFFLYSVLMAGAQVAEKITHLPVFDVHVHVMKVTPGFSQPICPWFLSDMPGYDPKEDIGFKPYLNSDCLDPWMPAGSDEELQEEIVGRIKNFNMSMIAFGDPTIMRNWMKEVPEGRIIPGISPGRLSVEQFRDSLESGFYKVMAEVGPQYQGMSPSDMSLDSYFAVAEELGIPAGIHMGTGGNGMANINKPGYRASMGDPFLLEDLLARHPKLKIYVMHAGYPMLEHMIALMGANAYVYVDISGMIWSYPLDDVNDYIKRMVQAGFGKRIMYGTDFISWPRMIETSMGVIEHAQYLSKEQKRDILFNNAARFFNLDNSSFDWPEEK